MTAKTKRPTKRSKSADSDVIYLDNVDTTNSGEDESLEDPNLFEEMNQDRIVKLENRAKAFAKAQTLRKQQSEIEKGLAEEIVVIMNDHQIRRYSRGDVHIDLDSTVKVKVSID